MLSQSSLSYSDKRHLSLTKEVNSNLKFIGLISFGEIF